jgi:hypothetical protein
MQFNAPAVAVSSSSTEEKHEEECQRMATLHPIEERLNELGKTCGS